MSNHDVYVSLDTSKDSDKHNRKSVFEKAKEQLCAVYKVIEEEESIILNFRVLKSFSIDQYKDIKEGLKGDYIEQYHVTNTDVFSLPNFRAFQERIEKSTFDSMMLQTDASKYRFLAPFMLKAELSPGLAFSELLLSLIYSVIFISIFMNYELTAITMLAGSCSLFLLLSVVHLWYGISRYPSIWNPFVPIGMKGSSLDRNFAEIRDICGYCHNGDSETNSQIIPFIITLPFTFIFHMVSFLVTAAYYLLKIPRSEAQRKYLDPIIASIFLSNALITCVWITGGKPGIIFATLSIVFNQKAYNSLMFKKNLKDFSLSLLFGNLLLVQENSKASAPEMKLTEYKLEYDLEEGIHQYSKESHVGDSPKPSPVQSLPPLLGVSSSSSVNSMVEPGKARSTDISIEAQKNYQSVINGKVFSFHSKDRWLGHDQKNESLPELFIDETASQQSKEDTSDHPGTGMPVSYKNSRNGGLDSDLRAMKQNNKGAEIKTEDLKHSAKSLKKKLLGFSHRIFSSPRNKNDQGKKWDDEVSIQFLNPSDVHLDIDTHPGTIEWRITVSESIQRFKIKSYTLRKHNWVMNQMHGKSFFIQEHKERRQKLKRKEIKAHCKAFHDKKVDFNSQISGILDDLKDLKKNHNNSKSNSDHTRYSASNISSQVNKKADVTPKISPSAEENMIPKENYKMSDSNHQTTKSDVASTAKESLVESSKDSTISTLTQSVVTEDPDETGSKLWSDEAMGEPDDSSSALKKAISGLLECTPWIDNINILKETGSIEEAYEVQHVTLDGQNTSSRKNNPPKSGDEQQDTTAGCDRNRNSCSEWKQKPYWHNFVDKEKTVKRDLAEESREYISGEFIPVVDLSTNKQRRSHAWRSDLQNKKLEKAREYRSQSKKVAAKQTKRIMSIWKKKKRKSGSYEVVLEESSIRKTKGRKDWEDDRHEADRRDNDSRPFDEPMDSYIRSNARKHRQGNREMFDELENAVCDKISNVGYGKQCGALEAMSACSAMIEQREDYEQDYLSDVKLVSTNRVFY